MKISAHTPKELKPFKMHSFKKPRPFHQIGKFSAKNSVYEMQDSHGNLTDDGVVAKDKEKEKLATKQNQN